MRFLKALFVVFLLGSVLSSCSTGYTTSSGSYKDELEGIASYYAEDFHGRKTSNGETYDMHAMTAAHRTLPFNSRVRVTNLDNKRSVEVRINDRGPFKDNRVIDLSFKAALEIGLISKGTAYVSIEVLHLGPMSSK